MEIESIQSGFKAITDILNRSLFKLGDFQVTVFSIISVLFYLVILFVISSLLRRILLKRLSGFYSSKIETILLLLHYFILTIGTLIILQSAGLDLSTLTVLAGAIGIGLGFGFQNVANNFISGLIILFERPIKVGDRIEIGEIMGQVMRIGLRSTTVLTNDNISIIIPNADFISDNVINWNHTDDIVRLRMPIGVSYESDPKKVVEILEAAIKDVEGVLKDRKSDVILDGFEDSSIKFYVRVWTQDFSQRPGIMKHNINMAIWEALKKENIQIPFPQMDLNIKKDL
ncbi:MAG: mechanosensitive ion channel domain-containing protein [Bdellovibrionota bacterium]